MREAAIHATLKDLAGASAAAARRFRAAAALLADPALRSFFAERAHDAEVAAEDLRFFVEPSAVAGTGAVSNPPIPGDAAVDDVLRDCEAAETELLAKYVAAFASPLPADLRNVVRSQLDGVQRDRDRLHALRVGGTETRPASP